MFVCVRRCKYVCAFMCTYMQGCTILSVRVYNLVSFMHIEVCVRVRVCVCGYVCVIVCFPHLRKDNVLHSTGEQSHYRSRNSSLEATALHVA